MMELTASKALRGEVTVPGDKSISHRSVMFGARTSFAGSEKAEGYDGRKHNSYGKQDLYELS